MKKIALKIALLFVAAFSFVGCSEVHDIAFPLDRTLWVTENYGNNDYYIKFNTVTFTMYNNNTGIAVDSGTYEYVYDYPCDMVYLQGIFDDYTLEYDGYTDTLYDLSYGYTYARGTYSD
ncbi:MAG: hypothetical protein SNH28_07195 [Rikenellaceae bacterium]